MNRSKRLEADICDLKPFLIPHKRSFIFVEKILDFLSGYSKWSETFGVI